MPRQSGIAYLPGAEPGARGAPEQVRILLADDHRLFREGLGALLDREPDLTVVGGTSSGHEVAWLAARSHPDVVLLDVEMPGPGVREVVHATRNAVPDARIIVLTMHDDPALVRDLIELGVSGYLIKTVGREEIVGVVRAAEPSRTMVSLLVSRETMEQLDRADPCPLSPRELEVLGLVARAQTNAQVARRLFVTEGTVKRHLSNIYAKLGARSRVDAINKAGRLGLITMMDGPDQGVG